MNNNTYTITIEYDNGCPGLFNLYYPIAIGISEKKANKLQKVINTIIDTFDLHNDENDSGFFCMKISREFCTNHTDFERTPNEETEIFFEKYFFNLKEYFINYTK